VAAVVGTVHLESLNYPAVRAKQLHACAAVLKGPYAVLIGDLNFCSFWNFDEMRSSNGGKAASAGKARLENAVLAEALPDFKDAWSIVEPGRPGFTFDSTRNAMLRSYEQMRYDRVLVGPGWAPESVALLGTEPLLPLAGASEGATLPVSKVLTPPRIPRPVFVSDHFGVRAVLKLTRKA